ncbi:MAG TPA: LpqB family beta-propeller domain-containing protein [Opitutus sp.]|nr:LpqB family beta-propeller domain-containing protein [Opitutus sp.]
MAAAGFAAAPEPDAPKAEPNADELARQAAAVPAAAFFARFAAKGLAVSPDGTRIAFIYQYEGHAALAVYERKSGDARQVMLAKNGDVVACVWKGNQHLLIFADFASGVVRRVMLADLAAKTIVRLDEKPGFVGIEDSLASDPRRVLAADGFGVYLYDVFEGKKQLVFTRPENRHDYDYGWRAGANGKVRVFVVDRNRRISFLTGDGDPHHYVDAGTWSPDGFGVLGLVEKFQLTGNGDTVYVVGHKGLDRGALYAIDTATGKWSEPVFVPPEGEITNLLFSPDRNRLEGLVYESDRRHYQWFDPEREKLQTWLEKALPGREVDVVSQSADAQVLIVFAASDRDPGDYFVADRTAGKVDVFVGRISTLDPRLMRPMEPITFPARDGLELHGYLTVPWASAHDPVPLVVDVHEGPYDERDSWGFNNEVQFLASRGYAVVQVNYRGSGGYGADFLRKGRLQWGRAMQDDLDDAVQWLIRRGVVDPRRVAIMGTRYGGYAALEAAIRTPSPYRCVINCKGYSDLEITWRPPGTDIMAPGDYYDYRAAWIGSDRAYRDATSPIQHADEIHLPMLHAYWEDESGIDWDHWRRLKSRLTDANKEFDFVTTGRTSPLEFNRTAAVIVYHEKIEAFLAKYLAPATP